MSKKRHFFSKTKPSLTTTATDASIIRWRFFNQYEQWTSVWNHNAVLIVQTDCYFLSKTKNIIFII